MWISAAIIATIAAVTALPASAAEIGYTIRTAGELASLCAGDPESGGPDKQTGLTLCDGFLQGMLSLELRHERAFCLPSPSPLRMQLMQQFVTWARANPRRVSMPATDGLVEFFRERFPCGKWG